MVKIQIKEKVNPIKAFSSTHNLLDMNILNPSEITPQSRLQSELPKQIQIQVPLQVPVPKIIPIPVSTVPYMNTLNHKVSVISMKISNTQTLISEGTHRFNQHYYETYSNKKKQKNSFEKFKKFLKNISCKNHSYFINLTLYLIVSINFQFTNSYIDKYSYVHFNSSTSINLFLNGVSLYFSEFLAIITFSQFRRKFNEANRRNNYQQPYAELLLILITALSCTVIQVAVLNNNNQLLLLFLILQKFASVYLLLMIMTKLENTKDVLMFRNRIKMTNLSRLSVFITYALVRCFQNSFLVLASLYYICFLVIIKIIL
jgi:hypothetical protein